MSDNNAKQTPIERLMSEYGWKTKEDMLASPEWKTASFRVKERNIQRGGGAPPTMAAVVQELLVRTSEDASVKGWFLQNYEIGKRDRDTGVRKVTARGIEILTETGQKLQIAGDHLKERPPAAVEVSPIRRADNLQHGTTSFTPIPGKTTAKRVAPSFPFPTNLPLKPHIEHLSQLPKVYDDSTARVVVKAISNWDYVLASFTVKDSPDDIYFAQAGERNAKEDVLSVNAKSADGLDVRVKLPVQQTLDDLGLPPDKHILKEALPGKRFIAHGKLEILPWKGSTIQDFPDPAVAQAVFEDLVKTGAFVPYKDAGGVKLHGLTLKNRKVRVSAGDGEGAAEMVEEPQMFVDVGGIRIYDIRETEAGRYEFFRSVWDAGQLPSMNAFPRPWANDRGSGVMDENAWVHWLDAGTPTNAASEIVKQLGLDDMLV